jgi:5'-methylthioadenosine phosphorylase
LHQNVHVAKKTIKQVLKKIPENRTCECVTALKTALVTNPQFIRDEVKDKYRLLINKYI